MRVLMLMLVATLGVAACSLLDGSADGPLVTIDRRGGLCPAGECRTTVVITSSGRITRQFPSVEPIAQLTEADASRLKVAIANTDFAQVRSRPFTGICPTAFDGQETIYTFASGDGVVRLRSCEFDLDPEQPVFTTLAEVLRGITDQ